MANNSGPIGSANALKFRLWFGLLAGGIAWAVHLIVAWTIAEFGCVSSMHEIRFGGWTAVAWSGLALSIGMLLVAASGFWVALRNERWLNNTDSPSSLVLDSRLFMAHCGVMANATFLFMIAVQSIPFLFYLGGC